MARVMYFDCFSGAAGDMVLGALLDAGLPLDALREALGSLGVEHELRATRVMRSGISATHVTVTSRHAGAGPEPAPHHHPHGEGPGEPTGHHHDHDHPHPHEPAQEQGPSHDSGRHTHDHAGAPHAHEHAHTHDDGPHRSVDEIVRLIDRSALSEAAKGRAGSLIRRLGEAEAAIHNVPVATVHLHEVGAVDSIIDIVGAVFAFEWFGIEDIVVSPLNVGGGTVTIAHGRYPVPAPATLRLLTGAPIYGTDGQGELVTPTGALVLTTYAKRYGPLPALAVERVGYGAGTRDVPGRPNVLRVLIGASPAANRLSGSTDVVKIECEIDDMSPQLFDPAVDRLLAAGALDVFLTPVQMKKNRPGTLITVLAARGARERMADILFRETTTLGVRFEPVEREVLDRTWVEVPIPGGPVRIKVGQRHGEVVNAVPEFDDCVRVATATGRSVKAVQADALRAWFARE